MFSLQTGQDFFFQLYKGAVQSPATATELLTANESLDISQLFIWLTAGGNVAQERGTLETDFPSFLMAFPHERLQLSLKHREAESSLSIEMTEQ